MNTGDTAVHIGFLTREVWDFIIFAVIAIGGVWALRRLRNDLAGPPIDAGREVRGPLPPSSSAKPERKEKEHDG